MKRQQDDIDDRSARILDSARRHFVRHGIESARLADIARDADVAVGTIYLRYRGKEYLLAGVLRQVENKFVDAMDAGPIKASPWSERLDLIFTAVIDTALADPDLPALMALASHAKSDGWRSGDIVRAAIEHHLNDGMATGHLDPGCEAAVAAALAYGMVEGAMASLGAELPTRREQVVCALQTAASRWLLTKQTRSSDHNQAVRR
jgi:AcrR family transcriptional regulator